MQVETAAVYFMKPLRACKRWGLIRAKDGNKKGERLPGGGPFK